MSFDSSIVSHIGQFLVRVLLSRSVRSPFVGFVSVLYKAPVVVVPQSFKPGSHLCDKHNTSDISISISTRKKGTCSLFLALMFMLMSLVLCLSQKWEPGFKCQLLFMIFRLHRTMEKSQHNSGLPQR